MRLACIATCTSSDCQQTTDNAFTKVSSVKMFKAKREVIVAAVFLLGIAHQGAGKTAALENSAVPYIPPENELYDFMNVFREGALFLYGSGPDTIIMMFRRPQCTSGYHFFVLLL